MSIHSIYVRGNGRQIYMGIPANLELYKYLMFVCVDTSLNQSTDSTDGSIVSECRLGKWS